MKKNQKSRRANKLFTLAALLVVLMSNVYVGLADPEILPLIWKYEEDGLTYERVCKPGKLVIMSNSKNSPSQTYPFLYLIDLTDGRIVYKSDPLNDHDLDFNYNGDRYYIYNSVEKITKEYDTKTNQYLKNVILKNKSSDTSLASFNYTFHALKFRNSNTGEILDSFKIPGTPNQPYYQTSHEWEFSNDSKYFAFSLITNSKPYTKRFYLYDRVNREIIFEKMVEPYYGKFRYSFFNNSNKMTYAEEVQLPGDDTIYSYLRIFDPEQRKVIRNLKITKAYKNKVGENIKVTGFVISSNDKYIIHDKAENWLYIYNLDEDKELDYSFGVPGSIKIVDSTTIYSCNSGRGVYANKLDLSVGVDDKNIDVGTILYPNPTNNQISLTIPQIYYWGTWQINDLTGTVVLKGKLDNRNDLTIDIGNLSPQIYYLTLANGKEKITYKIIKQ